MVTTYDLSEDEIKEACIAYVKSRVGSSSRVLDCKLRKEQEGFSARVYTEIGPQKPSFPFMRD